MFGITFVIMVAAVIGFVRVLIFLVIFLSIFLVLGRAWRIGQSA